jgi:hypothetical protein
VREARLVGWSALHRRTAVSARPLPAMLEVGIQTAQQPAAALRLRRAAAKRRIFASLNRS